MIKGLIVLTDLKKIKSAFFRVRYQGEQKWGHVGLT